MILQATISEGDDALQWDSYHAHDLEVWGPLEGLPRRQARSIYDRMMKEKDERTAELGALLAANGISLTPGDEGIQQLNQWYADGLESDTGNQDELSAGWLSVTSDIAWFLGDTIIDRISILHWEFFTFGKRNVEYQHPVVMGFVNINPKYSINFHRRLRHYGTRIVRRHAAESDQFIRWLEEISELVPGSQDN